MFSNTPRKPAWHRDAKWLSGVLLAFAVAVATLYISLAQLTRPALGVRVLNSVLSLTLIPDDPNQPQAAEEIVVRQGLEYTPGEPLMLIPGLDVAVSSGEIGTITPEAARARTAELLADALISSGAENALARVTDQTLNFQLNQAVQNTLPPLVKGLLETALFPPPAELGIGTRLADWPLQAQQRPGQEVQPIVGVFVTAPPQTLEPLTPRQIGEYVVNQLGLAVINEGLPAAQELVSREAVSTLLTQTTQNEVRQEVTELFSTLLIPQDAVVQERLNEARAIIAAANAPAEAEAEGLRGLTEPSALVGLSTEEANRVVVADIAEAIYVQGVDRVLPQLSDPVQAARVQRVGGLLSFLTRERHRSFVRSSYLSGFVVLLLLVGFMYFSVGWVRLVGAGLSIMAGAAIGALIFTVFMDNLDAPASLPLAPPESGIPGYTSDALRYTLQQLPDEAAYLFSRNHLVALGTGAGLIALFFISQLFGAVRPRQRRFL